MSRRAANGTEQKNDQNLGLSHHWKRAEKQLD